MAGIGTELRRKAVHMSMGLFALLLRYLTPLEAAGCAVAALLFNLLVLHRVTRGRLLRDDERERGWSLGILLYPMVVLLLIAVFHARMELAAAAWGLMAFGDGMATVTGMTLRGPRLPWNRDKTWWGFAAFVLYGTIAASLLIRWVQHGAIRHGMTSAGTSFLASPGSDAGSDVVLLLAGCLSASLVAALAESLRTGIDDNLLVPLVGGAALWAASQVEPARLVAASGDLARELAWGAAVNLALALLALAARGVGVSGAVVGWALGTSLWALGGWRAFLLLFWLFLLGTACTRLGWARKEALGIAQEKGGRRGARHAVANAGAGVLFAFLALATPYHDAFTLALVAAFATAAADTVSSEIGQAYGRTHLLITTRRRVPAGTDGAVSLEGTLAGIAASLVVGGAAWGSGMIGGGGAAIVVLAAFIGTTLESYLGATLVQKERVDNEVVNLANTLAGGLAAILLRHLV